MNRNDWEVCVMLFCDAYDIENIGSNDDLGMCVAIVSCYVIL